MRYACIPVVDLVASRSSPAVVLRMVVPCPSAALGLLETVAADLVVAVDAERTSERGIPVLV